MPAEQWQGLEINVGDELEFEVFRLDSDAAGVFCIRGKLNITRLVPNHVTILILNCFYLILNLEIINPLLKKKSVCICIYIKFY